MGATAFTDLIFAKEDTDKKTRKPMADGLRIDTSDNTGVSVDQAHEYFLSSFKSLPDEERHMIADKLSKEDARVLAADAVRFALDAPDAPTLRQIHEYVGIDPAQLSRIATGANAGGPQLASLSKLALALGKRLVIEIK